MPSDHHSAPAEPSTSAKPKSYRVEKSWKEKEDKSERKKKRREEKEKRRAEKKSKQAMPSEELIVITVNDRLGTKAKIPCKPSDKIVDLKKFVAAKIGRQVHEILLKRQSERPFRDELTLLDYSISNGAQIDLEVDTGD